MTKKDEEERDDFRKKLNQLWLCVLGNGHPEEGMKWKLELAVKDISDLNEFTKMVKKYFWTIIATGAAGAFSAIGLLLWKIISFLIENHKL